MRDVAYHKSSILFSQNLDSDLSVAELATLAHLSPSHFVQVFRQSVGMTPHQYVKRQRIAKAKRLLAEGHLSIAEVALAAGFANQSHFGEAFRQLVGATPKRYQERRGASGASQEFENIHTDFQQLPIDRVLPWKGRIALR